MTKLLNNRKRSELGAFVMSKRKALELSLTELAELTGISRSYLGQIESGTKGENLRPHKIEVLAQVLQVESTQIVQRMNKDDFSDRRKYGEYYRALRSNVRAARIAALFAKLRAECQQARSLTLSGKDCSKILQRIENTADSIDKTLAYRGRPPVSVQPGADLGDDEKFRDGRLSNAEG